MFTEEEILEIINLISSSTLTFTEIAKKYDVSTSTISNINNGKSYRFNREYPIRNTSRKILKPNEEAFCGMLVNRGYSLKQIHIILGKGSYYAVQRAAKCDLNYTEDKELNERLIIFDFITEPRAEFINKVSAQLMLEDFIYIKYLSRMGTPLIDVLELYLELIRMETEFSEYPIEEVEDINKYLAWNGTLSKIIWWIQQIYYNKINNYGQEPFYYDDINLSIFKEINPNLNMSIVKNMLYFETKENYSARGNYTGGDS